MKTTPLPMKFSQPPRSDDRYKAPTYGAGKEGAMASNRSINRTVLGTPGQGWQEN